jgi:hypothetical protein
MNAHGDIHRSHLGNASEHEKVAHPHDEVAPYKASRAAIGESEDARPIALVCVSNLTVTRGEAVQSEDIHERDLPGTHKRAGESERRDESEISLEKIDKISVSDHFRSVTCSICDGFPYVELLHAAKNPHIVIIIVGPAKPRRRLRLVYLIGMAVDLEGCLLLLSGCHADWCDALLIDLIANYLLNSKKCTASKS